MTPDELTIAKIDDKIRQCRNGYYITATGLLDSHEQALAKAVAGHSQDVRTYLYGGYEDAERRMLICVPADIPLSEEDAADGLLSVLRVSKPATARELNHRDYLGSLLGLGIDRCVTGDILVREDGADIIILSDMAGFFLKEYTQAGRTHIRTEIRPVNELIIPAQATEIIRDTVSSVRLDAVTAAAFRLSRAKASEAVRGGIVSIDHIECLKPDAGVAEGSVIVLRGKGKAVLRRIGEKSRKGRIRIEILKYI